jgi:hypothetical protein
MVRKATAIQFLILLAAIWPAIAADPQADPANRQQGLVKRPCCPGGRCGPPPVNKPFWYALPENAFGVNDSMGLSHKRVRLKCDCHILVPVLQIPVPPDDECWSHPTYARLVRAIKELQDAAAEVSVPD